MGAIGYNLLFCMSSRDQRVEVPRVLKNFCIGSVLRSARCSVTSRGLSSQFQDVESAQPQLAQQLLLYVRGCERSRTLLG